MNRQEYLKNIYDLYNAGEISAETYDYMWANANQFVEDEDEEEAI